MGEPSDILEVELKFIADGPGPLETLATAPRLGPVDLEPAERFDEMDRYLDTHDLAIATAGWACRLRMRGDRWIVSLKGHPAPLRGDGTALHRRPEIEGPATDSTDAGAWPPSEARSRLLGWTGGRPLVEQVRLDQRRTERRAVSAGRQIGVLSLDRVAVLQESRQLGTIWIVELELAGDEVERQAPIAAALSTIGGLRPDPRTKLERALELVKAAGAPARSE